jgi:hypothetical protein
MHFYLYLSLLLLCISEYGHSQVYVKEGKTRYTFAQTTFGYDMEFSPLTGSSYQRKANHQLEKIHFGSDISPVISITGLHFWGHAEFFTGFSLGNIALNNSRLPYHYKRSGATGAKYFPWAIQEHKIRPYIGMAVATFAYQQNDGVNYKRVDYPLLLGLTYAFKHGLLEIGCNYHYDNQYSYYISTTENIPLTIPALSFTVDYKYFFDFSMSSARMEKSGELERNFDLLKKKKKLSSLSIAAGPAYSFFTGTSSYNREIRPYLDDHQISKIYPDLGIGYYCYPLDATINLSWRFFNSKLSAYGTEQIIKRNSVAIEAFKFFGDYHGFVPFIGGIVSQENIHLRETDQGIEIIDASYTSVTPGIIVGWDIRPTRSDWWSIRTNIRYFPLLQLGLPSGYQIDLQQIELNFLQMVLYPNRIRAYLQKK